MFGRMYCISKRFSLSMKEILLTSPIRRISFAPASDVAITMALVNKSFMYNQSITALSPPEAIHLDRRHHSHFAICVGSQSANKIFFEVSCCFSCCGDDNIPPQFQVFHNPCCFSAAWDSIEPCYIRHHPVFSGVDASFASGDGLCHLLDSLLQRNPRALSSDHYRVIGECDVFEVFCTVHLFLIEGYQTICRTLDRHMYNTHFSSQHRLRVVIYGGLRVLKLSSQPCFRFILSEYPFARGFVDFQGC
ncbi:hypothetical protein EVAR_67824_1 [Eumeta japonica]|uniref:Uncharacterized protein n=1 Tax=Eumeta variegata TaxID=151549 RepID=A0A4C1ZY23_EUMVA|nr:hypothetical protein EVAR_67824_1 [Eumeta japonica]